jgi:alpha-mannosidase
MANFEARSVQTVDLLERPVDVPGVATGKGKAELTLRPFQLVTLRFSR